MTGPPAARPLRALILAPWGRDAAVAQALLGEIGVPADICTDLPTLLRELDEGAGVAIVTDGAIHAVDLKPISSWLSAQPHWSDFPFIVITNHGGGLERNPVAARLTRILENVSFLERPFHPTTLISMTRAALRARNRQYDARTRLEELRESEQRLQRAHDIGNIGDWSFDPKPNVFTWSHNAFRMHGLEPGSRAPTKELWLSTLHRDDRSHALGNLETSIGFGQSFECQFRVVHPSGEMRWLQMRGQIVTNGTQDPDMIVGTFIDITPLKHAQAALGKANETLTTAVVERTRELSQSEARFRAIFDSAVQLTGLIDAKGTLLVANQTALNTLGAKLEDIVGKPLWNTPWVARSPHEAERMKREVPRAAAGKFVHYELELALPPDGAKRVFDFSMMAVRDGASTIDQIVVEGRDVTELKQTQAALMQAQKMDTLGQITGGVAHDFNNLLMAVMGNLDLLRKQVGGDPRIDRLINGAIQGAKRGATLTQRLLAFARRQDLQAEAVDLVALIDGAKDLLARSIGPMIELRLQNMAKKPFVKVDPHQLELALLNLAVNSRDAMPKGGVITISIEEATDALARPGGLAPGSYLRLSVIDSGTGMDEATIERSIEPFFSTKELGKGTGLGLSMVHGLAVQSGGALRLSSTPGRGTTAEIWLPTADAKPAAIEQPQTIERSMSPATILVVDDDALIAMSTADMLQDLGHEVIEAYSGPKALEILRSRPLVQLMITDYAMPGMTGLQLAHAARELKPEMPVLLATGYADLPEGAAIDLPRLAKPYMQEQLASQVAKLLGH